MENIIPNETSITEIKTHWSKDIWRAALPILVTIILFLLPVPAGLEPHAWRYFAIFAGVIVGLIFEPLPNPAVGLIGVTLVTVLARWVLFSPADMAKPDFKLGSASLDWALAGFSGGTVWLIFSAFMFAFAYEKTGLGRRIALWLVKLMGKNTLTLGYATVFSDLILAPFTPSNTARCAGTIFPIVRNLPPLYDSQPNEPSAKKIGGYIMWTTFAGGCVTSSMFLTALAPNILAIELMKKIASVEITWSQWFFASAPFTIPLLLAVPLLTYFLYPPQLKQSAEVQKWASDELKTMGSLSRNEIILAISVSLALLLWIFGGDYFEPATVGLIVICIFLITGVLTWKDMANNSSAWTTLLLLASVVTLAGGLSKTGFVKWFADGVGSHVSGFSPTATILVIAAVYFFAHYMFASLTAHTTAMFPVLLAVGMGVAGVQPEKLALTMALTTGIMGVITPYATGPGLAYYESGYLPRADFWRLGTIFGLIFLAALMLLAFPLIMTQ